jgi:hypothetical protein
MTAYFTEPMSEEFRKAMEEAMKDVELDDESENKKGAEASTRRRTQSVRKSRKKVARNLEIKNLKLE